MSVSMLFLSLCGPKASAKSIELIMFKFLQNLYFWLGLLHENYFEQIKKTTPVIATKRDISHQF